MYLSVCQFIPQDRLQQVFSDIFGVSIATDTLARFNKTFANKVAPLQEIVFKDLKAQHVKHADETGFRVGGKTIWLHVLSSNSGTYYQINPKRGIYIDDVEGILVHDHFSPYYKWKNIMAHSACNAHQLRELVALKEIEKEPWAFQAYEVLMSALKISRMPYGCSKEGLKDLIWNAYDVVMRQGLKFHENQPSPGKGKEKRKGHNLVLRLINYKEDTLRFLTTPGVPFTNNQAEQDIRMMKVKQKISGGFRNINDAQDFCTIRGFISTNRKQGNPIFQAIQKATA